MKLAILGLGLLLLAAGAAVAAPIGPALDVSHGCNVSVNGACYVNACETVLPVYDQVFEQGLQCP